MKSCSNADRSFKPHQAEHRKSIIGRDQRLARQGQLWRVQVESLDCRLMSDRLNVVMPKRVILAGVGHGGKEG